MSSFNSSVNLSYYSAFPHSAQFMENYDNKNSLLNSTKRQELSGVPEYVYRNEVVETLKFWKMKCTTFISNFLEDINTQAAKCNFLEKERMLRDKIVLSTNGKLQDILLSEIDLTLQKTIDICLRFEKLSIENKTDDSMNNTTDGINDIKNVEQDDESKSKKNTRNDSNKETLNTLSQMELPAMDYHHINQHRDSLFSKMNIVYYNEDKWIFADDFSNFIKDHHHADDRINFRHSNMIREIKLHDNAFMNIDGKCAIRLLSILRFVFKRVDNMDICRRLCLEVQKEIAFNYNYNENESLFCLYGAIAKSALWSVDSEICKDVSATDVQAQYSKTKDDEFRKHFDNLEWIKICTFEVQFSSSSETDNISPDMDKERVKQKWDYYRKFTSNEKNSDVTNEKNSDVSCQVTSKNKMKNNNTLSTKSDIEIRNSKYGSEEELSSGNKKIEEEPTDLEIDLDILPSEDDFTDIQIKREALTQNMSQPLETITDVENDSVDIKPLASVPESRTTHVATPKKRKKSKHNPSDKFECQVCNKYFTASRLKFHMAVHTKEKLFHCQVCKKSFFTAGQLKGHLITHTGIKPFECNLCKKRFYNKALLAKHLLVHAQRERAKTFKCMECGKLFPSDKNLRSHMNIHTEREPLACTECGKQLMTKYNLKKHMLYKHTGIEKALKCDQCDKYFFVVADLKKHMLIHTDYKPYMCDTCGKHFRMKSTFKSHKRTHTGEKPFSCTQCSKSFSFESNFRNHMYLHSGKRRHVCEKCGKGFIEKRSFRQHKCI